MKNETIKRYNEMFAKFSKGEMTEKQWQYFCFEILGEVLEENKDVLIRLKNR
jgi:hypothetical protein